MSLLYFGGGSEVDHHESTKIRNRKREAGTPVEKLDVKKPKLEDEENDAMLPVDEIQPDQPMATSALPVTDLMEDVAMDAQTSAVPKATQKTDVKGKAKAKGDGGFKENPYTFLSTDDPILQLCMYVD
jgi:multisite-specific tRNA:(cytosine-C5)-methyltransferase